MNTLGQEVSRLRQSAGLTQAAFAAVVGLHPSTVANIEAGRRGIPAARLCRFADALGVTVQQLRPFVEAFAADRTTNTKGAKR